MTGAVACMGPAGVIDFPNLVDEGIPDAAFYTLHTDGSITHTQNLTGNLHWIENGAPTNYEVSLAGGAYQDFSSDRTINTTSAISLRDKWSTVVVKSVTVEFL